MANFNYNPEIFRATEMEVSKTTTLTCEHPKDKIDPLKRWECETPVIAEMLIRELELKHGQLVLDYGCGSGRLAKEFCKHDLRVIGVDIFPELRDLAVKYVDAPDKFMAISVGELEMLLAHGLKFDAGMCIWVLQHVPNPAEDIDRIFRALRHPSYFVAGINKTNRAVPVKENNAWVDDGISVPNELDKLFGLRRTIPYPTNLNINPDLFVFRSYMKTFSRN